MVVLVKLHDHEQDKWRNLNMEARDQGYALIQPDDDPDFKVIMACSLFLKWLCCGRSMAMLIGMFLGTALLMPC